MHLHCGVQFCITQFNFRTGKIW